MRASRFILPLLLVACLVSCKKKTIEEVQYDNVIYGLDDVPIYSSNVEKTKQKSATQYLSILYSDLFNQAIPTTELTELGELTLALGDKGMANELLLTHYYKDPTVVVPTNTQMRANVDQFVEDTYIRFYLRYPTEYEKYYLSNLITNDAALTPENIYTSFALSNEYYFY